MIAHNHAAEYAIDVKGLWKSYRVWHRKESIVALKGINLQVKSAEIFGFLGPNGSGKTTTIKILLGLLRPGRGTVLILGAAPTDLRIKQRLGYMPERTILPTYLRLEEMLRLFGNLSGLRGRDLNQAVTRSLEAVELGEFAARTMDTFSKGMLQRASLAQALLGKPELLLLDEPATGLDPIARHQLRTLLKSLRDEGTTIFLNSHELEVVQGICDRFAILHQGRILAVEPITALKSINRFVIKLGEGPIDRARLAELLPSIVTLDKEGTGVLVSCDTIRSLNEAIDAIRSTGALICSVNPQSVTLEDYFIKYLHSAASH